MNLPLTKLLLIFILITFSFISLVPKLFSSFVIILSVICILLFKRFKIVDILSATLLTLILIFNLLIYFSNIDNFFLFHQINHYIQIIIFIFFFNTIFKEYRIDQINSYLNKYFYFLFLLLLISDILSFYNYRNFANEFNIFSFCLLIFASSSKTKISLKFVSIFTYLAFVFYRATSIAGLLIISFSNYLSINKLRLINKISIITVFFLPFLLYPIINNDDILIFVRDHIDHNTFYRLESYKQAFLIFNSDIHHLIYGVGFGSPYRESFGSLSDLHHFNDYYSLNTIPNHNSVFDLLFRLGILGLISFIIFQYFVFININKISYKIFHIINIFFLFQISFNPWFEDQNQVFLSSLIICILVKFIRAKQDKTNYDFQHIH